MRRAGRVGRTTRGFSWLDRRASGRSPDFESPFCAAGRAMCANRGAIDHRQKWRIATSRKSGVELLPQSTLAPAVKPIEHRRPRTILGGQRPPAQAFAKAMQYTAEDSAIIHPWLTTQMREQRLDCRPLRIVQPKQFRHDPCPPGQFESDGSWSLQWVHSLARSKRWLNAILRRHCISSVGFHPPASPSPGYCRPVVSTSGPRVSPGSVLRVAGSAATPKYVNTRSTARNEPFTQPCSSENASLQT